MAKTFKFYSDAGHGWLAVKREFLVNLGVQDKISSYSYQRGKTVYLEEDCDCSVLISALRQSGVEFSIKEGKFAERSPIRSYESYHA
jgi:hypothetical protein